MSGEEGNAHLVGDDVMDSVPDRLATAARLVASIRRKLLQLTAEAAGVPKYSDMVREEKIPDIGEKDS